MITPQNKNGEARNTKLIIVPTGKVVDFADFMNEVIDFEEDELESKQTSPLKLE